MDNKVKIKRAVKAYIRRTYKNKIMAVALILFGVFSMFIDNDATGLVFLLLIAVPLFFSKRNWIY